LAKQEMCGASKTERRARQLREAKDRERARVELDQ